MKSLKIVLGALTLALSACGGDSIQSPDFTPELVSIDIDQASQSLPLGRSLQLTVTGQSTNPPGSDDPTFGHQVSADFEVSNSNIGTVDADGVFVGTAVGSVDVTATRHDLSSSPITITVTAPVLESIVVTPDTASVALGSTQTFSAQGVYSDSATPRTITTTVTWSSSDTGVATVSPATGTSTTATPLATGSAVIRASAVNEEGDTVTATADLTVTDALLVDLVRVEPAGAIIVQGFSQQYVAIGSYADGSEQAIDDGSIDWSSATTAVATIDAAGLAAGLSAGQSVITATLKSSVTASGTQRSASQTLTVTDEVCTTPFLTTAGATTQTNVSGLCIGCSVDDPDNVLDADPQTVATISVPVALLGGAAGITATAADGVTIAAGQPAGYLVLRPAGQLITAELLSQLTLTTSLDGTDLETSSTAIPLRVTLLGQLGDTEAALVSFTPTQDFDAVNLTLDSGVASALTTTLVGSACAVVTEPAAP